MYYVVSDIHGCYRKFNKLLKKINFSNDSDVLFVLGDAIDRGRDGIRVLQLMMKNDHMILLMGNHERMAYAILSQLEHKIVQGNERIKQRHLRAIHPICNLWFRSGGWATLKAYSALGKNDRESILNYMGDALPYFELQINDTRYVLVHAGIKDFDPKKELWEYRVDDFLYDRMDYEKTYFEDAYVISGHTPTDLIDPEYSGRIIHKNRHIVIDCGAYWGKALGCLCLDTMKEYYAR